MKSLILELESFESEYGGGAVDMPSFSRWLMERHAQNASTTAQLADRLQWNGKNRGGQPHYTASSLLTHLGRYKMNYVRMALEGTPFDTYDEFAFVLSLVFAGSYTQSQLIEKHVQLKPTGMEIIRRLLRKNLIVQEVSQDDKRSKKLSVTDMGRAAFYKTLSRINAVNDMVMSPLNRQEQLQLLELLQKLDKPHREVFEHEKKLGLPELMAKFNIRVHERDEDH
ncbi:hypothetical protein [Olivibacter sitiensis]|uniref:hypothetical protein n=1 Tax=Olivibacter sitiensis TaxID=376470 RepID=UPI0012FB4E28|nr:hypothetical protein [Olivibacter sitiensis]